MTRSPLSLIVPCGPHETEPPRLTSSKRELPERWERIAVLGPGQHLSLPPDWKILRAEFGRGRQLNQAAGQAGGDWLWFVHADTLPDERAIKNIAAFIEDRKTAPEPDSRIGYCRLKFDSDGPSQTFLNACGANWRSRWLKLPYGDQGLCLRKRDFDALGGFREDLQRGEDLDLVVRARSIGTSIEQVDGSMLTSARRYRENGWLRTTLQHQLVACRLIRNAKRSV